MPEIELVLAAFPLGGAIMYLGHWMAMLVPQRRPWPCQGCGVAITGPGLCPACDGREGR